MSILRSQKAEFWLLIAFLLGLLALASARVHSFDIFWQLQSGRYMLRNFEFIRTDLFTLAQDVPRFEHCWLHDLIVYGFYLIGGYAGLSVLKGILLTFTAGILGLTARLRGASWLTVLLFMPLFLWTGGAWLERPQLWTFLGFALFVWMLERHRVAGDNRVYWLIPVAVIWANLHAGSVLAIALWLAYAVGWGGEQLFKRSPSQLSGLKKLWLAGGLLAVTPLLTPYPDKLLKTLLGVARYGAREGEKGELVGQMTAVFNLDWRPTTFASEPLFFYVLIATAVIMVLGWRRLRLSDVCLLAGLGLMGLKLGRHTTFLYLGALAILPAYAEAAVTPLCTNFSLKIRNCLRWLTVALAVGLFLYAAVPVYRTNGLFNPGLREWHYPVEATKFIAGQQLPGNLYNTYDWGGYLSFQLFPDYLVFWDGRQNSSQMFRYGWQVMAGKEDWEKILNDFEVNTIVTRCLTLDTGERYPLLDQLQNSTDWALVFTAEASLVFVRVSAVPEVWLSTHRLPKNKVDAVIRSEAQLSLEVNPWRYRGWWELARLDIQQRRYAEAFSNLEKYLSRAPGPDPAAENYYRMLYPLYKDKRGENGH